MFEGKDEQAGLYKNRYNNCTTALCTVNKYTKNNEHEAVILQVHTYFLLKSTGQVVLYCNKSLGSATLVFEK